MVGLVVVSTIVAFSPVAAVHLTSCCGKQLNLSLDKKNTIDSETKTNLSINDDQQ
jgi:hypothetical protein